MKGAILAIAPRVAIVDLCHGVAPQDVRRAAFEIEIGHGAFAPGTVHVVVVDPGVGTDRRAIAVATAAHVFVAPDNGVLGRVLARWPAVRTHAIEDPRFVSPSRSPTFHGRDVFGPAAAWIARGTPLDELGPAVSDLVRLDRPVPRVPPGADAEVEVVAVDRFGNVVIDVRDDELRGALGARWTSALRIAIGGRAQELAFRRTYGDAAPGETFFLVGSSGYLEIARRDASAAEATGLRARATVVLRAARPGPPTPERRAP
jgi:S-adenosylmethionine hydrolase